MKAGTCWAHRGSPGLQNAWTGLPEAESPGFYKDQIGIVHLRGLIAGGTGPFAFFLPPGYRPEPGKVINFLVLCSGPDDCADDSSDSAVVVGAGIQPGADGAVIVPVENIVNLAQISFRAGG